MRRSVNDSSCPRRPSNRMSGGSLASSASVTGSKPSTTPSRQESSGPRAGADPLADRLEVPIDAGQGAPLVLLHGFGMRPATYGGLVELLSRRCRVVVPDLFDVSGQWRY